MAPVLDEGHRWAALAGPTWAEVDLDAVAANVAAVRSLLRPSCRLLAVVKADAYGHGAPEVARTVLEAGAAALGVSTVSEGLQLREEGIRAPILVLAPARPEELPAALALGLALTVADLDGARALAQAARVRGVRAAAHVECDTGMGRYGFTAEELPAIAALLVQLEDAISWEGAFTHFARGADRATCRRQLGRFHAALEGSARAGLRPCCLHAAASAAVLALPEAHLDMVRVGSLLYGENPSGLPGVTLRRTFVLRSRVAQVRVLPPGASVGYGARWRARRPTRVATLPVGFADGLGVTLAPRARRRSAGLRAWGRALLSRFGLDRLLGLGPTTGELAVGWARLRVLGQIGMQQVTVDCGGLAMAAGDTVTVHVASMAVGSHVPRVYLRDGIPWRLRAGAAVAEAPALAPGRPLAATE